MKTKETPASPTPESESALADAFVAPAFLTEEQAAEYLNLNPHQLYLYRRKKGTGPPFVMHGVRVRYRFDDLKRWAAALPSFTSYAAVLASNPARAKRARKQAATSAQAREVRLAKRRDEAKKRAKSNASANSESASSDA
jgi:hypothetical protein